MSNVESFISLLGRDESLKFWNAESLNRIPYAKSYSELKDIAMDILRNMSQPVSEVCGPISTGGYGDIESNIAAFEGTIRKLVLLGRNTFNQMPFEDSMSVFRKASDKEGTDSNLELLEAFYKPLFESGLVKEMYFINGWESSFGARWEHEKAIENGIGIFYLPKDFHILEDKAEYGIIERK